VLRRTRTTRFPLTRTRALGAREAAPSPTHTIRLHARPLATGARLRRLPPPAPPRLSCYPPPSTPSPRRRAR
jgi:hypothetical protein